MTKEFKQNFLLSIAFYGICGLIIFFSIRFLFVYLFPVIIGTAVTIFVQRPAKFVSEKTKVRKGICALLLVLLIYVLIISALAAGIYLLGGYISELATGSNPIVDNISSVFSNIQKALRGLTEKFPPYIRDQLTSFVENVTTGITKYITQSAQHMAASLPMFLTGCLVTVIASCYIAKDYDRFKASINSVLTDKYKRAIAEIGDLFKNNILKILVGYLKLMLITFAELAVGFILLRINKAFLIAAVVALLDMLPILGTGTVLIPWGIYLILTQNYFTGIGMLILYAIIAILRNIIEPKIIGGQIGLHPLIALISVFVGLKLFGFIGMLAAPLTVMLVYKMFDRGIFKLLFDK